MHWKRLIGTSLTLLCLLSGRVVHADEIVVEGIRYKDVLISKSSANYYVQIPWEGRTISAPLSEVDVSSVVIDKDPYYRDELKDLYEESKARREAGEQLNAPEDSDFQVQTQSGGASIDALLGAGGGGGGGGGKSGFTQSRADVEAMLTGFGMQFQPGPQQDGQPTVVSNPPGGPTITLMGPPNMLKGISIKMTGAPGLIQSGMAQLNLLAMQIAPALGPQLMPMMAEAQESGSSTRTAGPLKAQIKFTPNGPDVFDFELKITG